MATLGAVGWEALPIPWSRFPWFKIPWFKIPGSSHRTNSIPLTGKIDFFRLGSEAPIGAPQSSPNTVTREDREAQSEEQVQEQQQEEVDKQEEAQEGQGKREVITQETQQGDIATPHQPDVEALVIQLSEAKEKSAKLEKQIEEKDTKIDQLRIRIKTANISRLSAIDKNNLSEAGKLRKQYEELREAYNELEKEKDELEKQLIRSRAVVKRLELALQDSQIEVQSLNRRLRIKDEELQELQDAYKMRIRTRNSASGITMSNQISNEENTTIEEEQREEQQVGEPVSPLPSVTYTRRSHSRGEQCLMWFAGRGDLAVSGKGRG